MSQSWCNWSELHTEYDNSSKTLGRYISKLKQEEKDIENIVKLDLAREMKNELNHTKKVINKKLLYEFESLSDQDIKCLSLTPRQRQVAELRQIHKLSFEEIAEILGIEKGTTFNTYTQVINKIKKYKKDKELYGLSNQQKNIYRLYCEGKSRKQIAEKLNIGENTVKTHLRRIKEKLRVTNLSTFN